MSDSRRAPEDRHDGGRPPVASFGADNPGSLTYGDYLRVPELLSLQDLRVGGDTHDELLFIVIHQAYELWFRQILHELDAVIGFLERDQLREATRLLRRVEKIGLLLVQQIHLLETMTPRDFGEFRDALRPASGFQSAQFRELEFLTGVKDRRITRYFPDDSPEREKLERRLSEPDLHSCLLGVLSRAGFETEGPDGLAISEEDLARQLVPVYRDIESWRDIFELCEALVSHDQWLLQWRFHHVRVVERIIGFKVGTGGSPGVAYLNSTLAKRAFGFLVEVRSYIDEG